MALEKVTEIDKIEVVGVHKHVQVRTATVIMEDGKELSRSFHRHVVAPGDDLTNEDAQVKGICEAVHTQEVKDAYAAHVAAQQEV